MDVAPYFNSSEMSLSPPAVFLLSSYCNTYYALFSQARVEGMCQVILQENRRDRFHGIMDGSMESLNEIKKTFLQFVDILEEGLVSPSEFENAKRKLLRVFADTETPLRERLKGLAYISHVLSDDEQKEKRKDFARRCRG